MDMIIQRDIEKLIADTENVRQTLTMLERDHSVWARKWEEKDLAKLIERVKELECDVCLMMSDCSSFSFYGEEAGIIGEIQHLLACLNSLFQDIKQAKGDLSGFYIHPDEIRQLEIDWGRFKKTVGQIRQHLQDDEPYGSNEYFPLVKGE